MNVQNICKMILCFQRVKKNLLSFLLSLFWFSNSFKETRDVIVLYPFQGKHIGRHFVRAPVLRAFV